MTSFDFVLGNRYRLLSPLGEGGMASVFSAQDERLGRRVAVKVMSDSLSSDPGFVKRFQAEAESAAKLAHPNIVAVYDVGQDGNRRYIVMELVQGRNLKDIIEERGYLPVDQAVNIIQQVLNGLGFAHDHHLVHRDIKPQNILVTKEGVAKLADFGIAKAADASSATQTAAVLGSAHYFSPEQARGEDVSYESDLYSAGIVLYEMCTGVVPFDGSNLLSVAARHLNDHPVDPVSVNHNVPPALSRVVLKALSKAPSDRYASANEMSEALHELPSAPNALVQDTGATVTNMHPLSTEPETAAPVRYSMTARPAVLRHIFWGLLVAVLAVAVDRAAPLIPATAPAIADRSLPYAAAALGVVAALFVAFGLLDRFRKRYNINEHAVTVEVGILGHHRDSIPLPAIISLQLHQSPMARLFNLGTIVLTTAQVPGQGPAMLHLRDVSHASELYEGILRRVGGGRQVPYDPETVAEHLGV